MKAGEEFLLASAGELAGSMPIHFLQRLVASSCGFSHSSRAERLFGEHGVTILSLCIALSRVKDWGREQNCRTVIKLQTLALLVASECHGEP